MDFEDSRPLCRPETLANTSGICKCRLRKECTDTIHSRCQNCSCVKKDVHMFQSI